MISDAMRDALAVRLAEAAERSIKAAAWFPVKTGRLRDAATYLSPMPGLIGMSACSIVFDSSVAPYVGFLESGTGPHDIPGAFGYALPFGIGGRFSGRFHPGSTKHKGFISVKAFDLAVEVVESQLRRIGRMIASVGE